MTLILKVAVPGPFKEGLSYRYEASRADAQALLGCRVWVDLRGRRVVGVVVGVEAEALLSSEQLKPIETCIDASPLFDTSLRSLLAFVQAYYHAALGEVYYTAMPKLLCQGKPLVSARKGKVKSAEVTSEKCASFAKTLNIGQRTSVEAITAHLDAFQVHLLEGVTGSGKTEVYLELARIVAKKGQSVLVLVPEIGLTGQTLQRFQDPALPPLALYHSGLTETEKRWVWCELLQGESRVVVGTRSGVFLPFSNLGLIIVDEEHDVSYKQQVGVRYSAKSLAIMRAQQCQCSIILGSATPSVESYYAVRQGKWMHHVLSERAKGGALPSIHLIDMRAHRAQSGLSQPLQERMKHYLALGQQVLIFLNRRGYAPILMCQGCGERVQCPHCEITYTLHQQPAVLMCHHCGARRAIPRFCPACRGSSWTTLGQGTQQIEEALIQSFGAHCIVRLDQDSTRQKGSLNTKLDAIHAGEAQIIIGTQMLAKGHDFSNIGLVGIVDLDYGFFSPDFRGIERMGQLLIQVAGRSGRAGRAGEVLIQTHVPEHPLLQQLLKEGYSAFAHQLLEERQEAAFPPFQSMALLRAEHRDEAVLTAFLLAVKAELQGQPIRVHGPIFSALRKKAGFYQAQLLLESPKRAALQQALSALEEILAEQKKRPRYALDVDPLEVA